MALPLTARILIACLGMAPVAPLASAQELTSGNLQVTVKDEQGLDVPGVTITLVTPRGPVVKTTDEGGRAIFPFLESGQYELTTELAGFVPVNYKELLVRVDKATELEVTLKPGVAETVTVIGETPLINAQTASVGASLSTELFSSVPVNRNFTQVLALSPGVGDPGKLGENNPSVGGASGLENAYFIDGVNITNTGYGGVGSFNPTFGSLGTNVNFDFVEEVQVKTGGYEAEYGQALGGVVNVVTKSGTNVIRGSAFGYFQLAGLEGTREQPNVNLVVPTVEETESGVTDFGMAAGGPIRRDRIFWFGAINPNYQTRTRRAPTDFVTLPEGGILPADAFPLSHLGDVDLEALILSYSAKVSYAVSNNHRVDFTAFGDPSHVDLGPLRENALLNPNGETTAFTELDFGSHNQVGRYNGVFGTDFFLEGQLARAFNKTEELFPPENNQHQVTDLTRGGLRFGGIGQRTNNESRNTQANAKATYVNGAHQLKFGYQFEDIDFLEDFSVVGPPFSVVLSTGERRETFGGATMQKFSDNLFRVTFADLTNSRNEVPGRYHGFFAQDAFTVNERLTLNGGLRFEYERLEGTGGELELPVEIAPRVGATYDVVGDGRTKLYAHWGRYYQKIPLTLATKLLSLGTKLTRADYFDVNLAQQIPNQVVQTGAAFVATVDPDIKGMYQNEVLAGFEMVVLPQFSVGARFISRDLRRAVEDISNVTIPFLLSGRFSDFSFIFTNPGPGNEQFLIEDPRNVGVIAEPVRDYRALELTANKRLSDGWQLLASYRLSRLWGNYEGFQRNDAGAPNPAANPTFDFAAQVTDPLVQPDPVLAYFYIPGSLNTDRRHSFKIYGSHLVQAIEGLNIGYGFEATSGAPITPFIWNPAYNRADFAGAPRGSLGRTDWIPRFDMHADYPIEMGGGRRFRLVVDLFNVTNAQNVLRVEEAQVISATLPNPNFLQPLAYQTPRRVRLGIRFEF